MAAIMQHLATRENMIDTPKSVAIFVVGLIFTLTSTVSFALRIWAKRIQNNNLAVEDWLCLSSLVCVLGLFIGIVLHIQLGGMGHHFADLPMMDLSYTLQVLVAFQSLYAIGVGTVKSSIVFFYIRIFFSVDRRNRMIAYGVIAFIWAWVIMSVLVAFLSCTPFEFTWNPTIPGGHCDNEVGSFVAEATLDLVADLMVFALPLRPIWKLKVNGSKKAALFIIFGLGVTTMIIAILRIIGLAELDYTDFEWTAPAPIVYSLLEPAIGITVACIPLMQPIFQNTWLGRKLGGSNTSRNGGKKSSGYGPSNNFNRLDDDVPLQHYDQGKSSTMITTGSANDNSVNGGDDYDIERHAHKGHGQRGTSLAGGITVKHQFTTYTS